MIARSIGIYAGLSLPSSIPQPWSMLCCTGNGTQGLYYAWEAIVRKDGDRAQVNLLLNRAARLLDVDSWLPYEGKVMLRNKGARRIAAVTLMFPVPVTTERYTVNANSDKEQVYTCTLGGGNAPMKTVHRFAAERIVKDW